jgi:hypothetical protein
VAFEFLRDPVLGKVLRAQGWILAPIITYSWFPPEFISAGGPAILGLYPAPNGINTSIETMTNLLLLATSYDSIHLWVSCTITILMTEGNNPKESGSDTVIPATDSLDRMAGLLVTLLDRWENDRAGSSSSGRARELMVTNGEDGRNELPNCDANLWSSDQWVNLREDIDETIRGLRRHYIMPAASVERQRFVRDPDGICSLL